jgi:hypothetical protein
MKKLGYIFQHSNEEMKLYGVKKSPSFIVIMSWPYIQRDDPYM